jgi:hypothetical protein
VSEKGESCGYHGFEFGGGYLDAVCGGDGYLWDLDSCEVPGGPLYSGGEIPCPKCDPKGYREYCGCTKAEVNRRVKRAFGPTPWIPSNGPVKRKPTPAPPGAKEE